MRDRRRSPTGVVEQHVDPAQLGLHRVEQRGDRGRIADVGRARRGLRAPAAPARSASPSPSSGSARRPASATSKPSAARRTATARPMPEPAPVMTATLMPPSPDRALQEERPRVGHRARVHHEHGRAAVLEGPLEQRPHLVRPSVARSPRAPKLSAKATKSGFCRRRGDGPVRPESLLLDALDVAVRAVVEHQGHQWDAVLHGRRQLGGGEQEAAVTGHDDHLAVGQGRPGRRGPWRSRRPACRPARWTRRSGAGGSRSRGARRSRPGSRPPPARRRRAARRGWRPGGRAAGGAGPARPRSGPAAAATSAVRSARPPALAPSASSASTSARQASAASPRCPPSWRRGGRARPGPRRS